MPQEATSPFTFSSPNFTAKPLDLSAESAEDLAQAAWKNGIILGRMAAQESFYTDYVRGCDGSCDGFCTNAEPRCKDIKTRVAKTLLKPDTVVWEVWRSDDGEDVDFAGILRLSDIVIGCNAQAHYFFFDGRLKDKTEILQSWKEWAFSEHDNWLPLHRVTVEIPTHAFALARHASKHLDFGGPFEHEGFPVEGVMQDATKWRDEWHDILIMGCINES